MSSIQGVGNNAPIQKVIAPAAPSKPAATDAPAPQRAADRLELSGVGRMLQHLKANDIRTDKVAAIKAQIEAGTYEDDGKLNAAIDRLLDDLAD